MNYIFLDVKENKTHFGRVVNDKLEEYYVEDNKIESLVGKVFRARVEKTIRGMDAAFVNVGTKNNAYLPLGKNIDSVKGGDIIFVEVLKDAVKEKGPLVTMDIKLEGKSITITPTDRAVKINRNIVDKDEIYRLKDLGDSIVKDDIGIIIKKNAEGILIEEMEKEYLQLKEKYDRILREKNHLPNPKVVYKQDVAHINYLMSIDEKKNYTILTNDKEILESEEIKEAYLNINYQKDLNIKNIEEINEGILKASDRVIMNKDGISIVIDELEALTAIDINSGGYKGNLDLEETKLSVNLKIIPEIANQIKVRNLSGIILIDFLSLKDRRNHDLIIQALNKEFSQENNPLYIIGFTRLGMLETTRKRKRPSLKNTIMKQCEECNGRGFIEKL